MFFLNTNRSNLTNLFLYSSRIRELENFWSSERNQACLNCRVVTKVSVANYIFCVGDERNWLTALAVSRGGFLRLTILKTCFQSGNSGNPQPPLGCHSFLRVRGYYSCNS